MKAIRQKIPGLIVIMLLMIPLASVFGLDADVREPEVPELKPLFTVKAVEESMVSGTPGMVGASPLEELTVMDLDADVDIIEQNIEEEDEESEPLITPDFAFCCIGIIFIVIIVAYAIYNETKRQKGKTSGYPKYQWPQPPKWSYQYQYQTQRQTGRTPPSTFPDSEIYYYDTTKEAGTETSEFRSDGLSAEPYTGPAAPGGNVFDITGTDVGGRSSPAPPAQPAQPAPEAPAEPERPGTRSAFSGPTTICARCGMTVSEDAEFCPQCGLNLAGEWFKCPVCGSAVYKGEKECDNCGSEFKKPGTAAPTVVKRGPEPEIRRDFKPKLPTATVEKPERRVPESFDATEDLRKKPVEQLTERDINALRVENLELSDKLYELETDRAMGRMSRDEFIKKRNELIKRFLKK